MKIKPLTIIATLYFATSVITFGNAAVFFEARSKIEKAECLESAEEHLKPLCSWKESDGIAAAFSAAAWPFYWSYRLAQ